MRPSAVCLSCAVLRCARLAISVIGAVRLAAARSESMAQGTDACIGDHPLPQTSALSARQWAFASASHRHPQLLLHFAATALHHSALACISHFPCTVARCVVACCIVACCIVACFVQKSIESLQPLAEEHELVLEEKSTSPTTSKDSDLSPGSSGRDSERMQRFPLSHHSLPLALPAALSLRMQHLAVQLLSQAVHRLPATAHRHVIQLLRSP
jgi:hypothetical protein